MKERARERDNGNADRVTVSGECWECTERVVDVGRKGDLAIIEAQRVAGQ